MEAEEGHAVEDALGDLGIWPGAVVNLLAQCATMASVEAGYATELADARARLLKLKDRAAARARALGNAVTPSQRDALGDSNGLEDRGPASELQKLVAAFLLDPANGVPLDSHKIHREVLLNALEPGR
jgi:hypothetical protein